MANNKYLSRKAFDPTLYGGIGGYTEDVLNPDWVDPSTQDWGDPNVKNIGNYSLRVGEGLGGELKRPDIGITSYSLSDLGGYENGRHQYGVDSLERGQDFVKKYGGELVKGYQSGEETNFTGDESSIRPVGIDEKGWGYYWVPPGKDLKEQRQITNKLGLTKEPTGLSSLNDDQFGIMGLITLLTAGAAGGAFAGAGTAAEAGAAAGAAGAAETGAGLAGFEAAALGGPGVGTGLELTAAQMAAASQSPAVMESIAKAANMTTEELAAYMANPNTVYPNGTETATSATSTSSLPKLPPGTSTLASKVLGSLLSGKSGTSGSPYGPSSGLGGTGNSTSIFGSSGPTNQAVAVGNPSQQAVSPQTQQIAALLLQNPDQKFNPLAYQSDESPMLARIAKQLQEDDSYYG